MHARLHKLEQERQGMDEAAMAAYATQIAMRQLHKPAEQDDAASAAHSAEMQMTYQVRCMLIGRAFSIPEAALHQQHSSLLAYLLGHAYCTTLLQRSPRSYCKIVSRQHHWLLQGQLGLHFTDTIHMPNVLPRQNESGIHHMCAQ